jgi:hypothetical protein
MDVWVIAETPALAAELVSGAGQLAPSAQVTAFCGGDAAFVADRGAVKVYAMPLAEQAMWEDYVPVLAALARAGRPPDLVGATKRGRDVDAQLAAIWTRLRVRLQGLSRDGEAVTCAGWLRRLAMKTMTTGPPPGGHGGGQDLRPAAGLGPGARGGAWPRRRVG